MANVPEHSAAHRSSRSDCQIRQGAVEGTKPQPCLRWNLQSSAGHVTDDIAVADDDLEFVLGVGLELFVCGGGVGLSTIVVFLRLRSVGTMKVALECSLDPRMSLVGLGNGRAVGSPGATVGAGRRGRPRETVANPRVPSGPLAQRMPRCSVAARRAGATRIFTTTSATPAGSSSGPCGAGPGGSSRLVIAASRRRRAPSAAH